MVSVSMASHYYCIELKEKGGGSAGRLRREAGSE